MQRLLSCHHGIKIEGFRVGNVTTEDKSGDGQALLRGCILQTPIWELSRLGSPFRAKSQAGTRKLPKGLPEELPSQNFFAAQTTVGRKPVVTSGIPRPSQNPFLGSWDHTSRQRSHRWSFAGRGFQGPISEENTERPTLSFVHSGCFGTCSCEILPLFMK